MTVTGSYYPRATPGFDGTRANFFFVVVEEGISFCKEGRGCDEMRGSCETTHRLTFEISH